MQGCYPTFPRRRRECGKLAAVGTIDLLEVQIDCGWGELPELVHGPTFSTLPFLHENGLPYRTAHPGPDVKGVGGQSLGVSPVTFKGLNTIGLVIDQAASRPIAVAGRIAL